MPPALLWPPAGFRFFDPPVWFLADTTLHDVDTFGFRVFIPDGDTVWTHTTTTPCCTIPDTIVTRDTFYRWQCRIHDAYGWSRYSAERQFWVEFGHPALAETNEHRVLAFWVQSVAPAKTRAVTFKLSGTLEGAAIELLDPTGRRVRRLSVARNGALSWDMKDAAGHRAAGGVYFARLISNRLVITRKFVLAD
jgi:hypothetical protein